MMLFLMHRLFACTGHNLHYADSVRATLTATQLDATFDLIPLHSKRVAPSKHPAMLCALMALCLLQVVAAQPWQPQRCGPGTIGMDGTSPAQCDPSGPTPCCGPTGICGGTPAECACDGCLDFRVLWNTVGTCGPGTNTTAGPGPAQCDPRSAAPCCSAAGRCVAATPEGCACEGCVDYRPPWTADGRCGLGSVGQDGTSPAPCNPDSALPCCSADGWCGSSPAHCLCPGCVDHRPKYRADGRCGAGALLPGDAGGRPAECDATSAAPCCGPAGYCGAGDANCTCDTCTDYRSCPHALDVDVFLPLPHDEPQGPAQALAPALRQLTEMRDLCARVRVLPVASANASAALRMQAKVVACLGVVATPEIQLLYYGGLAPVPHELLAPVGECAAGDTMDPVLAAAVAEAARVRAHGAGLPAVRVDGEVLPCGADCDLMWLVCRTLPHADQLRVGCPFALPANSGCTSDRQCNSQNCRSGVCSLRRPAEAGLCRAPGAARPNEAGPVLGGARADGGQCGPRAPGARCADGQCCTRDGYCEPRLDEAAGLYLYNRTVMPYAHAEHAACANNTGDYRFVACPARDRSLVNLSLTDAEGAGHPFDQVCPEHMSACVDPSPCNPPVNGGRRLE